MTDFGVKVPQISALKGGGKKGEVSHNKTDENGDLKCQQNVKWKG